MNIHTNHKMNELSVQYWLLHHTKLCIDDSGTPIATCVTGRLVVKTAYPDQIDSPHENCRAQELSEGKI